MVKFKPIRPADYWVYPIIVINIFFGATALWASVPRFRLPALFVAILGNWFLFHKFSRDYSLARARIHLAIVLTLTLLFTWIFYILTN